MKLFLILLFSAIACTACCPLCFGEENSAEPPAELAPGRELITGGKAECVLMRDGKVIARECGRGVSPLLVLFDRSQEQMRGAVIVDKVIGRAAASIAICARAAWVHGEVMSDDAAEFLQQNGVKATCTLQVPKILNRNRDGLCPLEASVQGISDPVKALTALRAKVAALQAGTQAGK